MSRNYKFHNPEGLYFVSFAVVYWLDVFTRNVYKDILIESLKYCQKQKGNGDVNYIKSLNLLEDDEKIVWFDSQLTIKESGNFLTNKRLASYFINNEDKSIEHCFLNEIDSIKLKNLHNSWSYSSYIEVFAKNDSFKVYISQDSARVEEYYQKVLDLINK